MQSLSIQKWLSIYLSSDFWRNKSREENKIDIKISAIVKNMSYILQIFLTALPLNSLKSIFLINPNIFILVEIMNKLYKSVIWFKLQSKVWKLEHITYFVTQKQCDLHQLYMVIDHIEIFKWEYIESTFDLNCYL